jgi:adenosine deaminase
MIGPHHHAERFAWSPEDVLRLMHDAFEEASAATRVQVGLMIGIVRSWATEFAEEVARFAAENRRYGVVALGLAGAGLSSHEEHERFANACSIARSAGLTIVPHAGLLEGAANVQRALEVLAPKRIAHGVRAAENPSVLKRLAEGRVACDVCPSAEVGLGTFSDLLQVPVPMMLRADVPVTLNADDPLLFGSSIASEYALARKALGLSDHELALIAQYSIEASHLEASARVQHIARIATWLAA